MTSNSKILVKILFSILVFAFTSSVFSVSTEKVKESIKNSQNQTELMMTEENIRKQRELKEEKRRQAEIANEKTDKYLGIKYWNENYYELKGKFLRVELFGKTGTFNIFCKVPKHPDARKNDDDFEFDSDFFKYDTLSEISKIPPSELKEIALFSEADNSLSTGFLIKLDDEIYRLNNTNRVEKELRRTVDGAQLVYSIDHKIRFIVDFSLIASKKQENPEEEVAENQENSENQKSQENQENQKNLENQKNQSQNVGFGTISAPPTKSDETEKSEDAQKNQNPENQESPAKIKKIEPPIEDIVKIKMYTINIDKKRHEVAIKGIFDTIPGEGSSVHFSTNFGTKIRNEEQFSKLKMEKERTIVSGEDTTAFQFVLDGEGVAPVESVILANTDILYKMNWTPIIRKGRGFTNIRGYDDSAIMVDWPKFVPLPEIPSEHTFFIAAATNDESPKGLYYVDGIDYLLEASLQKDARDKEIQAKLAEQRARQAKKNAAKTQSKQKTQNSEKKTNVDFVVPPIKDYQLDPEYIQGLIDRIDALQSSKNVDRNEVRRLNAELDAILEKLRRQ